MKHLYIIRHGETDFNVQHIVQGKGVNSSLNPTGEQQSLAFFRKYAHIPFDAVLTSSLQRTIETAQHFIKKGIRHYKYPELDEIGWGVHEGKPASEEMRHQHKSVIAQWQQGNYHASVEEGESAAEIHVRLREWLKKLKALPYQHLLICTHGAVLAFLMTMLQNEPLSEMPNYKHNNTGLCKFNFDGVNFNLELQNDISHLEP